MPKTAISFLIGIVCWLTAASAFFAAELEAQRKIVLTSAAFQPGADIPRKYTCDAEDVSPPLRWTNAPAATKSFAVIADDPDAPGRTWVHWVIYDLPSEIKELAEGMPKSESLGSGAKQGVNDFRQLGYDGPCPPPESAHRYYFRLYALDAPTISRRGRLNCRCW
jgi:Raf kinase inhibitor-like YbhB/YbcL family protein